MSRMVDDESWFAPPIDKKTIVRAKLASVGILLDEPGTALPGAPAGKSHPITVSFDTSDRDGFFVPDGCDLAISPVLADMLHYRPRTSNELEKINMPDDGDGYEGMIHG